MAFKTKEQKVAYRKNYYGANKSHENKSRRERVWALREKVLDKFGRKCNNVNCRHLNENGSLGCTDVRLLQVDHVNSDGSAERNMPVVKFLTQVLESENRYQLLCASCNWLKRYLNDELVRS